MELFFRKFFFLASRARGILKKCLFREAWRKSPIGEIRRVLFAFPIGHNRPKSAKFGDFRRQSAFFGFFRRGLRAFFGGPILPAPGPPVEGWEASGEASSPGLRGHMGPRRPALRARRCVRHTGRRNLADPRMPNFAEKRPILQNFAI